ncbi:hypothetical protein OESDEN_13359 [Oesophagostomum dentatum]|uniref:Uncharacterized protein n=1 Tax=Oesophagostomum dentatum TaxID=61180 RepID=A0A0B1SNG2_OESDE|nr:hypothetical protein OESDEN_13359 [Oesophagostomum dentatum]
MCQSSNDNYLHGTTLFQPGYLLHSYSHHSIYATTEPGMYKYIPTQIEELRKKSKNYDASFAFAVRTVDTLQIVKWLVFQKT